MTDMTELEILRAVNFDWTMHLASMWVDPPFDVPELHSDLRAEFVHKFEDLLNAKTTASPLGWLLVGSGGTGKTHLLSILRREAMARGIMFVLVDMTDVHDFWDTVLQGYLGSLQQQIGWVESQHSRLLERFIEQLQTQIKAKSLLEQMAAADCETLVKGMNLILTQLRHTFPVDAMQHQDVIRAIIALHSQDFVVSGNALTWLQGVALDETDRRRLGLQKPQDKPINIVRGLSWMMSLCSPTVLAFDQLDPVVTQFSTAALNTTDDAESDEQRTGRAIVERIGSGLSALRDVTRRTMSVLSCVEGTLELLRKLALKQDMDRFEPPRMLSSVPPGEISREVVRSRLAPIYEHVSFQPPYSTWPFASESFKALAGLSPRQMLKLCHQHQRECLQLGRVVELESFHSAPVPAAATTSVGTPNGIEALDATFSLLQSKADVGAILDEKNDDHRVAALLQAACRCLLKENPLPFGVDGVVDVDFGDKSQPSLHARMRLIFVEQRSRERHFCVRAIERRHASSFQSRLKAAMTASGIDRRLSFRSLSVLRSASLPTGPATEKLTTDFKSLGGQFQSLTETDARVLFALAQMEKESDPDFVDWLVTRKPASQLAALTEVSTAFIAEVANAANGKRRSVIISGSSAEPKSVSTHSTSQPPLVTETGEATPFGSSTAVPSRTEGKPPIPSVVVEAASSQTPTSLRTGQFVLGNRLVGEMPGQELTMPLVGLEKHAVVLAGAGSGKTVLLRRLIEQAALEGVPSVVVDCANDLAALGDRWAEPPKGWVPGDEARSRDFFDRSDVIIWTPGREGGNPLNLEPLPDLGAVADDRDELETAVEMVCETLRTIVAPGSGAAAKNKAGILAAALRYFAQQGGGSLQQFVALLAALPDDAGIGISKETKLAAEMADRIKAEIAQNPLLNSCGKGLNPALLFGDVANSGKTRVSVISLIGLPSLEAQRQFLNQLAMTLFSWIKRNPSPPNRSLRGLLVIDEAKDFIPSRGGSACKSSLMRLTAQARKYHLGVVFATQNPKEIESAVVGNCSTHYYGKANSPQAIDVIKDQIRAKGGDGSDIAKLTSGRFYVYNADAGLASPAKVMVPMCLSQHPINPLTTDEVISRAANSRLRVEAS